MPSAPLPVTLSVPVTLVAPPPRFIALASTSVAAPVLVSRTVPKSLLALFNTMPFDPAESTRLAAEVFIAALWTMPPVPEVLRVTVPAPETPLTVPRSSAMATTRRLLPEALVTDTAPPELFAATLASALFCVKVIAPPARTSRSLVPAARFRMPLCVTAPPVVIDSALVAKLADEVYAAMATLPLDAFPIRTSVARRMLSSLLSMARLAAAAAPREIWRPAVDCVMLTRAAVPAAAPEPPT